MNIVILCKSWNHGKVLDILSAILRRNVMVRGIVALSPQNRRLTMRRLVRSVHQNGSGAPIKSSSIQFVKIVKSISAKVSFTNKRENGLLDTSPLNKDNFEVYFSRNLTIKEYAQQHGIEMNIVDNLNGEQTVESLRGFSTDILVLAGVPIIRSNILSIPKIGTLNAHMGLLPWFRGMNVAEWSILEDAPVGISVHLVDEGVDTGAILYREKIDVYECKNVCEMRSKVSSIQHQALARCVQLLVGNRISPIPQEREQGRQYYEMNQKLIEIVNRKLQKGYQPRLNLF